MVRIGLSPPPIRRASPPASNIAGVAGVSVVTFGTLRFVTRRFLFDEGEILVVDDALLAGQRDEAFSLRANRPASDRPAGPDRRPRR